MGQQPHAGRWDRGQADGEVRRRPGRLDKGLCERVRQNAGERGGQTEAGGRASGLVQGLLPRRQDDLYCTAVILFMGFLFAWSLDGTIVTILKLLPFYFSH